MPKFTWPATRKELYAAGYTRDMTIAARPCKRCHVPIEFWRTPEGNLMPLEENPEDRRSRIGLHCFGSLLCHFSTCLHAREFRKAEFKARPIQRELF